MLEGGTTKHIKNTKKKAFHFRVLRVFRGDIIEIAPRRSNGLQIGASTFGQ